MASISHLGLLTSYPEVKGKIFLSNGEPLLKSLLDKWRDMHAQMGFQFIHCFSPHDPVELHRLVFRNERLKSPARLASFGPSDCDLASIFCKKGSLVDEIISSLHFLEQTIKIFGFETRVYLVAIAGSSERGTLTEALKQKKMAFEEESSSSGSRIEFRLFDEGKNPHIVLEEGADVNWIRRSLFGSIENWVELMVKKSGSKKG